MSFTFLQQGLKIALWVTTSTLVLKSHTGATQVLTGARESRFVWRKSKIVHYYRFASVLVFWHKRKFAVKSVPLGTGKKKYAPKQKIGLQTFFSELTSHTTKESSSVSCPVFCRGSLNPETKNGLAEPPVPTSLPSITLFN